MIRSLSWLVGLVFLSLGAWSQAVQVDDLGAPSPATTKSEVRNESFLFKSSSLQDVFRGGEYGSAGELRTARKLGVGAEVMGRTSLIGLGIDLNFDSKNSAKIVFGLGPDGTELSGGWKWYLLEGSQSAYFNISGSRWAPRQENARFFASPGVGYQFFQTQGESAGASFFAELVWMTEIETFQQNPRLSLGTTYFF